MSKDHELRFLSVNFDFPFYKKLVNLGESECDSFCQTSCVFPRDFARNRCVVRINCQFSVGSLGDVVDEHIEEVGREN